MSLGGSTSFKPSYVRVRILEFMVSWGRVCLELGGSLQYSFRLSEMVRLYS